MSLTSMLDGLSVGSSYQAACACPATHAGPSLATTCGGGAVVFMGLLEMFLRSQCDIADPCNRIKSRVHPESEYDFIVIGGGSGGSVIASRLSEVPQWKVLLVEAGPDEPVGSQVPSMVINFIGSSIDWGYLTEPEENACLNMPQQRCYWPRGKVLGGTSVFNGMMYTRGARQDYDAWAAAGNEGWSYDEVLPYFRKSENNQQMNTVDQEYHSTGGPLTVSQFPYHPPLSHALVRGAEELGYPTRDINGKSHTGFAVTQTTNSKGTRMSAARAFLRPAHNRPNLHVMLKTTVAKILINETTKTAYGIEIRNSFGGSTTILANKEVILSAGALGSPQILQLSGVGEAKKLRGAGVTPVHELPGVGQNLQNHVGAGVTFTINDNNTTPLSWAAAAEYLLFRDGLMSGTGISEVTGFINTKYADPAEDNPDVQLFFLGFLAHCADTGMVGESMGDGQRSITMYPTVLRPQSRGYLEIRACDPTVPPKIFPKYLTHPHDTKTLIEGIRFAIKLGETKALKAFGVKLDRTPVPGCESHKFDSDAYWECAVKRNTNPEHHQAGSCKMGPATDAMAVVDNSLQVHGLDRLRVVDASIIPSLPSGNTNAPIYMIGEKAADMIKSKWLGPGQ